MPAFVMASCSTTDNNTDFQLEDARDKAELAARDLAVELRVPDTIKRGEPFDVEVTLTVRSLGLSNADFVFVLPDGLEILASGGCPPGIGTVLCVDAVSSLRSDPAAVVSMIWNPEADVTSAVIEITVTDDAIDEYGFAGADGNPDNNTTTASLKLG